MTGRLTERNGYWNCVISFKDELGKYRQKWIKTNFKGRASKKKAKAFLDEEVTKFAMEMDEKKHSFAYGSSMPFSNWIKKYVEKKRDEVSKITYVGYKRTQRIICEHFGKELRLKDVTYKHIENFFRYLKHERQNKNSTIKYYSVILYPALREAYKKDYISKNPVDFMPPIKQEKAIYSYYNNKDLKKLFKTIKGHRAELAIKVAAFYGLRRSELAGLKWESVDFSNKIITIENKLLVVEGEIISTSVLKTKSSYRALPLLAEIEEDLKNHKENIEKNKELLGKDYNDEFSEYVFVNEMGDLLRPHYLSQSLRTIIKENKLKKIRFHDLRHSCASLLLANGVGMKQIQEWLGHSNFNTTADIYSHLDYSSKIEAANKLGKALNSKKNMSQKTTAEILKEINQLKQEIKAKEKLVLMQNKNVG